MELVGAGSLMDTRDTKKKSEREQLQFDCQSCKGSRLWITFPLIDETPLFPIWALRGSRYSVSLAYIWTAG